MQADNLREEDVLKMERFFEKEIKPKNPKAKMRFFGPENFNSRDCLFKKNCQGWILKEKK